MIRTRKRRIGIIKQRLLRRSWPRLQVSLILLSTGLTGFLTSFSLLHLGIPWMWLRYPIAIVVAYCVFLLLLRFWLSLHWIRNRTFGLWVDLFPSPPDIGFTGSPSTSEVFRFSGGGDAGGGGAGGSWGPCVSSASTSSHGSLFNGVSVDLDLQEGWLIVIAIVALIGGLFASLYIVYIAPTLLAEVLIDGALVAGLYRRVKRVEQRHWLRTALRQTVLPALLAAIFFTVAGYTMQRAVPKAHSMGEVWRLMGKVEG
jgi:hypothetical protein